MRKALLISIAISFISIILIASIPAGGEEEDTGPMEIHPGWFRVEWEIQRADNPGTLWMCDWSDNGTMIACVYFDRTVNIYHAKDGGLIKSMTFPESTRCDGHLPKGVIYPMRYVDFSDDSTKLAVCGDDKLVRIVDTGTWEEEMVLEGHEGAALCVNFAPNGTWLVSGSGKEKVNGTGSGENIAKVWDLSTGKLVKNLTDQTGGAIVSARFSPSGKYLAVNSDDTTICIYHTSNLTLWKCLDEHTSGVLDCDWNLEETRIVSGSRDYTARVWDLVNNTHVKYEHDNCVRCTRWDRTYSYFITSGIEKRARLYNPAITSPVTTFYEGEDHDSNVMASRFSPDNKRFVSAMGKKRYLVMYKQEKPPFELIIFTKTRVGIGIFLIASVIAFILIIYRPIKQRLRGRRL